jgi:uncharacterized membrane protein YhdT
MNFVQDPRIKVARKAFLVAWVFYGIFLLLALILSYSLGLQPLVFGLPRWVAMGSVLVPAIFVILVIFVAEKFIPDIPLTDEKKESEGDR